MEKIKVLLVCLLMELLQFTAFGQFRTVAQSTTGAYSVTVNTPGTLGQILQQEVDNWDEVAELTIIGSIDSCDMNCFSKLQNIERLDLSGTDIEMIRGCADLKKLSVVNLPASVSEVADSAFTDCSLLQDINLDSVCKIGNESFYNCREIKNVKATYLQSIGRSSFYGCNQLETFAAPNVITVGAMAFYNCNRLREFDFSRVKYLDYDSFGECHNLQEAIIPNLKSLTKKEHTLGRTFIRCSSLKKVYLGEQITEIPSYTFYSCSNLSTIKIPSSVQTIGKLAFGRCHMSSLEIPEGISELNDEIYNGYGLDSLLLPASLKTLKTQEGTVFGSSTRLKDLFCNSIIPLSETGLDDSGVNNATLHVPACSMNNYKNSEVWNSFGNIVPSDDKLTKIEIYSNYELSSTDGISENAELILTNSSSNQYVREDPAGHLTFSANQPLKIGRFTQIQNWALNATIEKPYSTTLIANNYIAADSIELKLSIHNFEWNFISFPFDVCIDDISLPENTSWVIRKYSGQDRAAMSGNSWQNLEPAMLLHASEGYIIHATLVTEKWDGGFYSGPYTIEMSVRAVDNINKNKIFASDNVSIPLRDYPSEFGHNRSWNLIGNPYPCYFDINGLNYIAPITIWDNINHTYDVVSPLDDTYVLRPNEAFFVQKNDQSSSLEFDCQKRLHTMDEIYYSNRYSIRLNSVDGNHSGRDVYNFYISNGSSQDKSRIVLNELAKPDYELERDASKFLSFESTTPQIFNFQDGVKYAINERPSDSEGYYLGINIGDPGEYTLKMDCNTMDTEVYLTDILTGEKINLRQHSYKFVSDKGCFDQRFKVLITKRNENQSSIHDITKDYKTTNIDIYNLKGQRVDGTYKGLKIINGKKTL